MMIPELYILRDKTWMVDIILGPESDIRLTWARYSIGSAQ